MGLQTLLSDTAHLLLLDTAMYVHRYARVSDWLRPSFAKNDYSHVNFLSLVSVCSVPKIFGIMIRRQEKYLWCKIENFVIWERKLNMKLRNLAYLLKIYMGPKVESICCNSSNKSTRTLQIFLSMASSSWHRILSVKKSKKNSKNVAHLLKDIESIPDPRHYPTGRIMQEWKRESRVDTGCFVNDLNIFDTDIGQRVNFERLWPG